MPRAPAGGEDLSSPASKHTYLLQAGIHPPQADRMFLPPPPPVHATWLHSLVVLTTQLLLLVLAAFFQIISFNGTRVPVGVDENLQDHERTPPSACPPLSQAPRPRRWYVVTVGLQTGIFSDW